MAPRFSEAAKALSKLSTGSGEPASIIWNAPETSQRRPPSRGRRLFSTGKARPREASAVTPAGAPRLRTRKRMARAASSTGSTTPQGSPGTGRPVSASNPRRSCAQRSRKAPQPPARASQGQSWNFFMRNALRGTSVIIYQHSTFPPRCPREEGAAGEKSVLAAGEKSEYNSPTARGHVRGAGGIGCFERGLCLAEVKEHGGTARGAGGPRPGGAALFAAGLHRDGGAGAAGLRAAGGAHPAAAAGRGGQRPDAAGAGRGHRHGDDVLRLSPGGAAGGDARLLRPGRPLRPGGGGPDLHVL